MLWRASSTNPTVSDTTHGGYGIANALTAVLLDIIDVLCADINLSKQAAGVAGVIVDAPSGQD
jgi:hypothetical protein